MWRTGKEGGAGTTVRVCTFRFVKYDKSVVWKKSNGPGGRDISIAWFLSGELSRREMVERLSSRPLLLARHKHFSRHAETPPLPPSRPVRLQEVVGQQLRQVEDPFSKKIVISSGLNPPPPPATHNNGTLADVQSPMGYLFQTS